MANKSIVGKTVKLKNDLGEVGENVSGATGKVLEGEKWIDGPYVYLIDVEGIDEPLWLYESDIAEVIS